MTLTRSAAAAAVVLQGVALSSISADCKHLTVQQDLFCMSAGPKRGKRILLPFQLAVLVGIAITYTVVGGDSFAAFARGISPGGVTSVPKWGFFLVFGGLQVLLSMVSCSHRGFLVLSKRNTGQGNFVLHS